jgi:hypothetical protein
MTTVSRNHPHMILLIFGLVYDETCIMFRTMRDIGFLNRARESAAFCQMLAMSSWHLSHLNSSRQREDHLGYSLVATQELQNQISNSQYCTTDDAIGAVLVFACCAVRNELDFAFIA